MGDFGACYSHLRNSYFGTFHGYGHALHLMLIWAMAARTIAVISSPFRLPVVGRSFSRIAELKKEIREDNQGNKETEKLK